MNKHSLACNDETLFALLRDELTHEENESSLDHLENCTACQQRLSDLIASGDEWKRAAEVISASDDDVDDVRSFSVPSLGNPALEPQPISWTESMAAQLLSPPSHPEMLGRLGRYDVERLIGSGGMGVVFKAFDGELNRPVAIKLLAPYLASSGPARKRFAREARAAAAVVHQHVVPIHNVENDREAPLIVMRFVPGESLQARVDREGPLELCTILRIGMQVADGLSAAHQQGLVHRDIKPSNILLEEDVDHALITDFGLARAADDASLTRTGFHPGTPQYMSPEQASGRSVDGRSDLFSLGSMLYTMCAGRPPFRADNSLGVMKRITETNPTPIREINPSIPDWLCSIVNKLMRKEQAERFQSANEVHELLEACLSHVQDPQTNPLPPTPPTPATTGPSVPAAHRSFPYGILTMKNTLVAICLLFGALLIPVSQMLSTQPQIKVEDESPLLAQFRAADKITDQGRRDQAFAALAKNAAKSGDLLMTRRALEHIRRREVESPTSRDCAIAMFQLGKHEAAYTLAESTYYQKDRDAAFLALAGGAPRAKEPAMQKAEQQNPPKQTNIESENSESKNPEQNDADATNAEPETNQELSDITVNY